MIDFYDLLTRNHSSQDTLSLNEYKDSKQIGKRQGICGI